MAAEAAAHAGLAQRKSGRHFGNGSIRRRRQHPDDVVVTTQPAALRFCAIVSKRITPISATLRLGANAPAAAHPQCRRLPHRAVLSFPQRQAVVSPIPLLRPSI